MWFDTRNAANNTDSQLFYSYSTDGGVTWSPNVAVSDAFTPFEGYPNQNKLGDYITIVSDNTGGDVAYSATYNFNPSRGQHEQDVYYVRVSSNWRGHAYADTYGYPHTDADTDQPRRRQPSIPTATPTAGNATPTGTPTATPTATPSCTPGWSAGATPPECRGALGWRLFPGQRGSFMPWAGGAPTWPGSEFMHPFEYDPGTNTWTTKAPLTPTTR